MYNITVSTREAVVCVCGGERVHARTCMYMYVVCGLFKYLGSVFVCMVCLCVCVLCSILKTKVLFVIV